MSNQQKIYNGETHIFTASGSSSTGIIEIEPGYGETLNLGGAINIVSLSGNPASVSINGNPIITTTDTIGTMGYQNANAVAITGGLISTTTLSADYIHVSTIANSNISATTEFNNFISASTFSGYISSTTLSGDFISISTLGNSYINASTFNGFINASTYNGFINASTLSGDFITISTLANSLYYNTSSVSTTIITPNSMSMTNSSNQYSMLSPVELQIATTPTTMTIISANMNIIDSTNRTSKLSSIELQFEISTNTMAITATNVLLTDTSTGQANLAIGNLSLYDDSGNLVDLQPTLMAFNSSVGTAYLSPSTLQFLASATTMTITPSIIDIYASALTGSNTSISPLNYSIQSTVGTRSITDTAYVNSYKTGSTQLLTFYMGNSTALQTRYLELNVGDATTEIPTLIMTDNISATTSNLILATTGLVNNVGGNSLTVNPSIITIANSSVNSNLTATELYLSNASANQTNTITDNSIIIVGTAGSINITQESFQIVVTTPIYICGFDGVNLELSNAAGATYISTTTIQIVGSGVSQMNLTVTDLQRNGYSVLTPGQNLITNGDFQVWQRGAGGAATFSITPTTAIPGTYVADRWQFGMNTAIFTVGVPSTISQIAVTSTTTPDVYCCRVQRNNNSSIRNQMVLNNSLTITECFNISPSTLTLSFQARGGVNFVTTVGTLNYYMKTGTGLSDQSWMVNAYTGAASPTFATGFVSVTTSFQSYADTIVIGTGITQASLYFGWISPSGTTAGTTEYVDITNVKLEIGAIATPFVHSSFQNSLQQCLPYYCKSFDYNVAPAQNAGTNNGAIYFEATNTGNNGIPSTIFPSPLRVQPTFTVYCPSASSAQLYNTGTASAFTGTGVGATAKGSYFLYASAPSGTVSGNYCNYHYSADASLY